MFHSKFHELFDHYENYCHLYTDGSKMMNQVASAAVLRTSELPLKLSRYPNIASIFRAELYAITLELGLIRRNKAENCHIL